MSKYIAEYAKSSRSKCQVCEEKIPKDCLRIGKMIDFTLKNSTFSKMIPIYFHFECFMGPQYEPDDHDINRHVYSNYEMGDLTPEDKEKVKTIISKIAVSDTGIQDVPEISDEITFERSEQPLLDLIKTALEKYLSKAIIADLKLMIASYSLKVTVKKPLKADFYKTVIKAPITEIPGIVYTAIDKHMTAVELKSYLSNLSMKITGSKKVLIWRLLKTVDIEETSLVWRLGSATAKKSRRRENHYDYDFDNSFYLSSTNTQDCYVSVLHEPNFKLGQKLITFANQDNLEQIKVLLSKITDNGWIVNYANTRHEVDYKWGGYSKEWDWYTDTPLIAAVRRQNQEVVAVLLKHFANPLISSCRFDDVHEDAITVAETLYNWERQHFDSLSGSQKENQNGGYLVKCNPGLFLGTEQSLVSVLMKYRDKLVTSCTIYRLLESIKQFWNGFGSSSHYNNDCKSRRAIKHSEPTDKAELLKTIDNVLSEFKDSDLETLTGFNFDSSLSALKSLWKVEEEKVELERKKAAEEGKRKEEERLEKERIQREIREEQLKSGNVYCRCGQLGATTCLKKYCINCCTESHCPRHGGVTNSISQSYSVRNVGKVGHVATQRLVLSNVQPICICSKPAAFKCINKKCSHCCKDTRCARHFRLYYY